MRKEVVGEIGVMVGDFRKDWMKRNINDREREREREAVADAE